MKVIHEGISMSIFQGSSLNNPHQDAHNGDQSIESLTKTSFPSSHECATTPQPLARSTANEDEPNMAEELADSLRRALDGAGVLVESPVTHAAAIIQSIAALRQSLTEFFEEHLAPRSELGFHGESSAEVDVHLLRTEIEALYLEMQSYMLHHEDDQDIDYASFAQHLSETLMEFLEGLDDLGPRGLLDERSKGAFFTDVLNFRAGLTSVAVELQDAELQLQLQRESELIARIQDDLEEGVGESSFVIPGGVIERSADRLSAIIEGDVPPIVESAQKVFNRAASFVLSSRNYKAPAMGFQRDPQKSFDLPVAHLLEALESSSDLMENVLGDRSTLSSYDIQFQIYAQNLQTATDLLRLRMVRDGHQEVVSGDAIPLVASYVHRAQSMVTKQVNKLTAYLAELKQGVEE